MLESVGMRESVVFFASLLREAFESGLSEDEKNWYAGWKMLGSWSQNINYGPLEQQIFEKFLAVGQRRAGAFLVDKGDVWDVATDALAIMVGRCARARTPEFSLQTVIAAMSSDTPLRTFYSLHYLYLKIVKTLAIKRRARLLKQWSRFAKA